MALCNWLSIATELIAELFDEGEARLRRGSAKILQIDAEISVYISEMNESAFGRETSIGGRWILPALIREPFDFVRGFARSYNGSDVFSGCGTSFAGGDRQV
jgi:hypothetical protein